MKHLKTAAMKSLDELALEEARALQGGLSHLRLEADDEDDEDDEDEDEDEDEDVNFDEEDDPSALLDDEAQKPQLNLGSNNPFA